MPNTDTSGGAAAAAPMSELVGSSPAIERLREQIAVAARLDEPVLILGETGSGKELVARCIHAASARGSLPLQVVNCAGVRPELLAAELFGHRTGAFTGAGRSRAGRMRAAEGSSILLDEISETGAEFQAAILRAVETGEIQPLGADRPARVCVRVLATSNRPLRDLAPPRFRSDLLHRLAALVVRVPPLRERRADIAALAEHFLARLARRYGTRRYLSEGALDRLHGHAYPGNVRELRQILVRAFALSDGDTIRPSAIERSILPLPDAAGRVGVEADRLDEAGGAAHGDLDLARAIRRQIRRAIALADDNLSQAARLLGIPRSTLQHYLAKYDIDPPARRTSRSRAAH